MSSLCWVLVAGLLLICLIGSRDAVNINHAFGMNQNQAVRFEFIDPNNTTIWKMLNLTNEQVTRIQAGTNAKAKEETTQATNNQRRIDVRQHRLNEIRATIQNAVNNKSDDKDGLSNNGSAGQKMPIHEVAGYPICSPETSTAAWQQSNNVTLHFASSIFENRGNDLHLESAVLRLYKTNLNGETVDEDVTTSTECAEPTSESQIRITVSIVQQLKKKQRKNRICNTMMIGAKKIGWVEIDVKCAIHAWGQQQTPPIIVGLLMIEIDDDEVNPLKPGLYFQPPKCEQADTAYPWRVYGSETLVPGIKDNKVPRYPRLDVCYSGFGSYAPKNMVIDAPIENIKDEYYDAIENKKQHINSESTTLSSSTVDNFLDINKDHNQRKEQIHHHRKRHHHSQATEKEPIDLENLSNNSNGSGDSELQLHHHRSRTGHHHHHNHHHHHHKYQHQEE